MTSLRRFAQVLRSVLISLAFTIQGVALATPCLVSPSKKTMFENTVESAENSSAVSYVESDKAVGNVESLITLSGNVLIHRKGTQVRANQAVVNMKNNHILVTEGYQSQRRGFSLSGESAEIIAEKLNTHQSRYQLTHQNKTFYGHAKQINEVNTRNYDLKKASLTTCAGMSPLWRINVDDLNLDQNTGLGRAKHMSLTLGKVPIFYFPYVKFPIDNRRRSGFLMPFMEYSETRGLKLGVPWYWNIAPNADATLTPIYYSKNGLMLDAEFRYKHAGGQADFQVQTIDDQQQNKLRYEWSLHHDWKLSSGWHSKLNLQQASDNTFSEDYGSTLTNQNIDYLKSYWQLNYRHESWSAGVLFEAYDILTEDLKRNNYPYRRLPKLWLNKKLTLNEHWAIDWKNTLTRFTHEDQSKVQGDRFHQSLALSGDYTASYYFLKPSLSLLYTHYRLENQNNLTLSPLLSGSVGTGLYFERLGQQYTQVLSPQLFYVRTPFRRQNDFPRFDSSLTSLSYYNLFRGSRYTGQDRIGDANQTSVGVTWQILDNATGQQMLEMGFGRRYSYIDTQVVAASSELPIRKGWSDSFSYAQFEPTPHWKFRVDSQYNLENNLRVKDMLSLHYQNDYSHVNLAYRYQAERQEQITAAVIFDLSARYRLLYRNDYDIKTDRLVERMLGLEYDDCCFGLRVMATQNRIDDENSSGSILDEPVFHIQLVFKGLGQMGSDVEQELSTLLPGYEPK